VKAGQLRALMANDGHDGRGRQQWGAQHAGLTISFRLA